MAPRRNCKHQGFTYTKNGKIRIVCDYYGEIFDKEHCRKCGQYDPRKTKEGKNDS